MLRLHLPAGSSGTTGLHKFILTAAWCCLLFLAFATLAPLHLRPKMTDAETWLSVLIEHVGAFGVLGLLFTVCYPRRYGFVCVVVFGSAVLLELLQLFVPDRDARIIDAVEKIVGGAAGIAGASWLLPVLAPRISSAILPRGKQRPAAPASVRDGGGRSPQVLEQDEERREQQRCCEPG
jgi:VanZ like family